ncbi:folate transporter 1 [Denticeps clupeoides]|uniref:Solute carrier family 19 member 1 n=1 Tax=Denticeps clupeoides TaxID=299321 RepID=A0AAY4AZQ0_9TELE|nr:folate transporter 1 [Denticeps clupeoides]XP_028810971.1 folate transporter 1 [Denticeps clupeoides]XP_028810972.1 folate transporter 1 [Denticeps clupeoides]XP_028810973.1 folate transporter 1 [Denticeps clupeoides]XP_028810974.1 folate transporter 1 [Denticeps clupeoides]XP_028810975.1 folate transporter 1 [Denticeps clupeoides]
MVEAVSGDDRDESNMELNKEDPGCLPDTEEVVVVPSKPDPGTQSQAWKWSVVLLCFYGFMVQLKPGEPFITPYLLSPEKNFTESQVTNEISPVLPYSYMVALVPIFLLTDYLRYKPVLILQSMSYVSIWLILLLGKTLLEMQLMEFFYGITMAARVAYSSYIFSLVPASLYQRVAGYSRSSVLLGVFTSSVMGQLCYSLGNVSYTTLSAVSLGFVIVALLQSTCLPWPKRSMFFNKECREEHQKLGQVKLGSPSGGTRSTAFMEMLKELKNVPRVPSLRLWSIWWVLNSAGYYLVVFYVHILWNKKTENNKVYNGGVEAASNLLGAIMSFAAGYVKIRWNVWSELVIGVITATMGALLIVMVSTTNIWVCYLSYILFRGFYQFLVPIAIFQIASFLTKELCALVFGINTFLSTILKSTITLIVADKRGLALPVDSQFLVYFFYFALLTLSYLVASVFVITRHFRHQRQSGGPLPEAMPTELCPMAREPQEPEAVPNGSGVKA